MFRLTLVIIILVVLTVSELNNYQKLKLHTLKI